MNVIKELFKKKEEENIKNEVKDKVKKNLKRKFDSLENY